MIGKIALIGVVGSFLLYPITPEAQQVTPSGDYQQKCQQQNDILCLGLILGFEAGVKAGVANSSRVLGYGPEEHRQHWSKVSPLSFGCIPREASYSDMYNIWLKHLEDNPQDKAIGFRHSFMNALVAAYPCD